MVLKNGNLKIALAVLGVGISSSGWADELLWWVTSQTESDVVPLYEGAPNPFPMRERPAERVVKVVEEPQPDPAALAAQARSAQLLEKIRSYLKTGKFSQPNVYTVTVRGFLEGVRGPVVLIGDTWYAVGDHLAVPAKEYEYFRTLVNELQELAPEAYDSVANQIEGKVSAQKEFDLRITAINKENIELTDQNGETYVISYLSQDW